MKKILKPLMLLGLFLVSSCETSLDSINTNPNDPESVHPKLLLTNISKEAFQVESDNMYASRMLIATDGENEYQYLKWNSASFEAYPSALLNVWRMIKEAENVQNENYQAIGLFFRAYYFFDLTMKFGAIPYHEAVGGESGITQPRYDSQEEVLVGILKELEEANQLINPEDIIENDIIFNGDYMKWKKLINSFRLKVLISLSHKTTVGDYNVKQEFQSIAQSQPLMESIEDNGELKFVDAAGSRYTKFNDSGYGSSLYMADYFINLFKERKDPRLFSFAEQTTSAQEQGKSIKDFTSYNGGNPISPYSDNAQLVADKNISKVNERYYKDPTNEASKILGYSELQFILAEAAVRGWVATPAKEHYEKAIKANFEFYQKYVKKAADYFSGFDVEAYLATPLVAFNSGDTQQQQLEKVLTQKFMTMFHQSQWTSYRDYLRTGFPKLPLQEDTTAPFRFRYPQSEYDYNRQNLQAALKMQFGSESEDNIHDKTWWLK